MTQAPASQDKPPRLLLHVGLPKTATTSLQRNVLMPLHRSQRINFVGRCVWRSGELHDMLGPFRAAIGHELTDAAADALRPSLEALLRPDRLNVISDERMAGMETVGEGAEYGAVVWLDNLRRLFRRADATVLVCLRSPVDFVLSAYAEAYYWRFYETRRYNTFGKFIGELLEADEHQAGWIVFFYAAYLAAVRQRFEKVKVLLYEDLLHDAPAWHASLAPCLGVEPAEVAELLAGERHNVGTRTATGRRSQPFTVGHFARRAMAMEARSAGDRQRLLQRFEPLVRLYRKFAHWELPPRAHHRYPSDHSRQRVHQHLGLDTAALERKLGVPAEKLARYGYLRPDFTARRSSGTG